MPLSIVQGINSITADINKAAICVFAIVLMSNPKDKAMNIYIVETSKMSQRLPAIGTNNTKRDMRRIAKSTTNANTR